MDLVNVRGDYITETELPTYIGLDGIVFLHNANSRALAESLQGWTRPFNHPHAGQSGITVITPHAKMLYDAGMKGFTREALKLHTDRSTSSEPPAIVATIVLQPSPHGGQVCLQDGYSLLHTFDEDSRVLKRRLAEVLLKTRDGERFPVFEFQGEMCKLRYREDDVAQPWVPEAFAVTLSRLRESLIAGSPILMSTGDGYILHNHRYLHGRTRFVGDRTAVRILADIKDDSTCNWMNQGFYHRLGN